MTSCTPARTTGKHLFVCLLLLAALLGAGIAAAAHIHMGQDVHEGQCALCMSCAQMVAVCIAFVVALLMISRSNESLVLSESKLLPVWIPLTQRVRPPPVA
jgi:hypothetical protein